MPEPVIAISPDYIAQSIADFATQALRDEAALYPKPGLVSPVDSGSHQDMNYAHFVASIACLADYFQDIAGAGMRDVPFASLKALGLQAERDMLRATQGINTHRGAIFNLGLLCAAAAWLRSRGAALTPGNLGDVVAQKWRSEIMQQSVVKPLEHLSHGEHVAARYGIRGARLEATQGYPAVVMHGLPAYRSALRQTGAADAAAVQALFAIMRHVDDTNILWRAGPEGLAFVKQTASAFLAGGGVISPDWKERAIAVHRQFVSRRLSPGGAADLLGVTLFMHAACN